jgi:hypothetical protein
MNRGLALLMSGKDSEAEKDFAHIRTVDPTLKHELEERIQLAKDLRKTP